MSERPLIKDHEGHALRRGPTISLGGDTCWVCIDCRVLGVDFYNMERARDLPEWTDQDYWDNVDWIES